MHGIFVFNHTDESLPCRNVRTCNDEEKALSIGCEIVKTLAKDFNEEIYIFMEEKVFDLYGDQRKGVHIFNGNVPWSVFVTGSKLDKPIIGPIGYDKNHEIDLGEDN